MRLKKNFHSRLFGFAGFSGSGKTTLIEKLIVQLNRYRIGYIKHDAHQFSMDHQGKDTYRQYAAGAQLVFINDPGHFAMQMKGESCSLEKEYFKDCEVVLVEGHKYSDHAKLLFLDQEGLAQKEFEDGKITNVIATISCGHELIAINQIPAFHRDDIAGISEFLVNKINESLKDVKLLGLVLAGGKSQRMGQNKALINYHGKPQARHLMEVMENLSIPAYVSCRQDQVSEYDLSATSVITDRFLDFGPLGGILSAMVNHPGKAWLVIACDLPFVNEQKIADLISARDPLKQASVFFNQERSQFEPLFAIYEPSIYSRMLYFLGEGMVCPQKVLFNSSIKKLDLKTQDFLQNVNTPEEKTQILSLLQGSRA